MSLKDQRSVLGSQWLVLLVVLAGASVAFGEHAHVGPQSVVDPDPTSAGFENPNAVRCGVEAVPFILLVNPQGEVVDIHLMGDRLSAALAAQVKS